jgi:hypothetical protein
MKRLQAFNLLVMAVAYEIQESFPQLDELTFEGLRLLTGLDSGVRAQCEQIFTESVIWLCDEEFVRCGGSYMDGSFALVTLTEKGASRLLSELPHGVGEKPRTVGKAIEEVGHSGIAAVAEGVVTAIIGTFLGGRP